MVSGYITIDEELCTLCGQCEEVCCVYNVLGKGEDVINIVKPEWCNLCGHCVGICPVDAIIVGADEPMPLPKGKAVTPEQMMVHIRSRRSVRHYKEEPVPRELIEQVIDAGRFAPTGANFQGIHYIVVEDPKKIDTMREKVLAFLEVQVPQWESQAKALEEEGIPITDERRRGAVVRASMRNLLEKTKKGHDRIFYDAPVVILLHGLSESPVNKDNADLMAMCMLLMAESLGLGTCLMGLLNFTAVVDETLRELIDLPGDHQVFASFVMGYPRLEFGKAPGRKPARIKWL
jgi:nitroreductase/NAD-dependent dihydropyrimidine dehydrogenase PreA subunit